MICTSAWFVVHHVVPSSEQLAAAEEQYVITCRRHIETLHRSEHDHASKLLAIESSYREQLRVREMAMDVVMANLETLKQSEKSACEELLQLRVRVQTRDTECAALRQQLKTETSRLVRPFEVL